MARHLRLELTLLWRSRTIAAGLIIILAAGVFAVMHGRSVIDRQRGVLAGAALRQQLEHRAILAPTPPTSLAGDQLYYLFFHTVREPSAWAPAFIGQRDLQPYNLKVRMLALQGQLYDAELGSPLIASFGAFDVAFVFVVLAPLLVIALTFNIISAEREGGTWDVLRAQPVRASRVMVWRFAITGVLVWSALIVLLAVTTIACAIPIDRTWVTVAVWLALYVSFWVAAAGAVNALGRASEVNALLLLGLWMTLTIVGPALTNAAAAARFPVPEGLELTIAQREGYHSGWDRPLDETMQAFYARYPQWASVPIPADRYSNGWYYAMQQRGDDLAAPIARRYRAALEAREQWTAGWVSLFPPAVLQRALSRVAGTDLQSYLAYLDSVSAYHESLKEHFFPIVFGNQTVADVDWSAVPRHSFRDR